MTIRADEVYKGGVAVLYYQQRNVVENLQRQLVEAQEDFQLLHQEVRRFAWDVLFYEPRDWKEIYAVLR